MSENRWWSCKFITDWAESHPHEIAAVEEFIKDPEKQMQLMTFPDGKVVKARFGKLLDRGRDGIHTQYITKDGEGALMIYTTKLVMQRLTREWLSHG
jgi:hypothetical protein